MYRTARALTLGHTRVPIITSMHETSLEMHKQSHSLRYRGKNRMAFLATKIQLIFIYLFRSIDTYTYIYNEKHVLPFSTINSPLTNCVYKFRLLRTAYPHSACRDSAKRRSGGSIMVTRSSAVGLSTRRTRNTIENDGRGEASRRAVFNFAIFADNGNKALPGIRYKYGTESSYIALLLAAGVLEKFDVVLDINAIV